MAASLFNRRSLDGWLGELDDIRGDALASPEDGVSHAMADVTPLHAGDVSPLHLLEQPLPPALVQPSPHPTRPSEMWHPQVSIVPSPVAEVRLDREDVSGGVEDDATDAGRFRFARVRAVGPEAGELVASLEPEVEAGPGDGPLDVEAGTDAELFAVDSIIQADGAPLGIAVAPHGSTRSSDAGRALLDWSLRPHEAEPSWSDLDADGLGAPEAAEDGEADLVVQPVAEPAPMARLLAVAVDGTVAVDQGIVRVAEAVHPVVEHGPDGIALALDAGWCWADRTDGAAPLTISGPVGSITIPTGTAALAVIEADRTCFVVVVEGEAVLQHHGGRLRLRAGAMALAPVGAEPRIDVATEAEILADPLVQHNLRLDGER